MTDQELKALNERLVKAEYEYDCNGCYIPALYDEYVKNSTNTRSGSR